MQVVTFTWKAKFGHFLRAEASASALSYPVPPRTTVLGLLGAILGLAKDEPQQVLQSALIAISGKPPQRFWHKGKLRKDPPNPLPWIIKKKQRGSENPRPEKATLILQEWLWKPQFQISLAFQQENPLFQKIVQRLQQKQWHFCPSMGLSEMIADLEYHGLSEGTLLPYGEYEIEGFCPQKNNISLRSKAGLGVHLLRMPYSVDSERVFQHQGIYIERQGNPLLVTTDCAWQIGERIVIFL
jgi:CRISPR-associated protein Cas5h